MHRCQDACVFAEIAHDCPRGFRRQLDEGWRDDNAILHRPQWLLECIHDLDLDVVLKVLFAHDLEVGHRSPGTIGSGGDIEAEDQLGFLFTFIHFVLDLYMNGFAVL